MAKELKVLVNDEELGTVIQHDNGRLSFVYSDEWRMLVDAFPLSLSMPLTQREHGNTAISNYLWGLLSDNDAARTEVARRFDVSPRSAFALVAAGGEDLPGAVQMVRPEDVGRLRGRSGAPPISEKRLAAFLSNLVAHPGETQITEDAGSFSLAGIQPKKAICWVGQRWYEPRGRTPSTHIIKPPMPNLDGQVENEHFCLRLADQVGLRAITSSVVKIGGTANVVAQRYDRVRINRSKQMPLTEAGGIVYRVHQEDICQALGYHPDKKYQRDGGPGLRDVMALLNESGDARTDRDRFMRASIFNFVILGVDAHAKNYSILMEPGGRFRLAPLYDVISALPYDLNRYGSLAMNVGGERKWRNISYRHWEKEARACNYSFDTVLAEMSNLLTTLPPLAERLLAIVKSEGLNSPTLDTLVSNLSERCVSLAEEFPVVPTTTQQSPRGRTKRTRESE